VAQAVRDAGHEVRLLDLQVESHRDYFRVIDRWRPDVVAFSGNYLANVPEIIDLAIATKSRRPGCFICVGGHSASFIARALLAHGGGAIDCVVKGEGEVAIPAVLACVESDRRKLDSVPGAITAEGEGPKPLFVDTLDAVRPARDLLRHRHKYFLGVLDPCASIEFSRGCPWDCVFCSAWTFYGRSYRLRSPERIIEDLQSIREKQHGFAIGEAIARSGIRKRYYLETRGDMLLRNKNLFKFWKELGLEYMFIGIEAIDSDGLRKYRKRVPLGGNFEALAFARSLGIQVAVNLIAEPDWDRERFATIRQWCMEVPEVVNLSVKTPYPGTEIWLTEAQGLLSRDYRLFDIQHCVLPTRLPLGEFYQELVSTQRVLHRKHLGWRALKEAAGIAGGLLLRGQTNFLKSIWKFDSIYNPDRLLAEHRRPVRYEIDLPPSPEERKAPASLYIHASRQRPHRAVDTETEHFVEETRGESRAAAVAASES
jgi:hopanoid C-3 methylase